MIVTLLLLTLAALGREIAGAHVRPVPPRPAWLPVGWYRLFVCETRMDWRWGSQFSRSRYEGAPGFYSGTWDAYKPAGFPDHAWQASPKQQYRVARIVAGRVGLSAWGCYRHNGWVRAGFGR